MKLTFFLNEKGESISFSYVFIFIIMKEENENKNELKNVRIFKNEGKLMVF
mgnify:CR=1 FL=1